MPSDVAKLFERAKATRPALMNESRFRGLKTEFSVKENEDCQKYKERGSQWELLDNTITVQFESCNLSYLLSDTLLKYLKKYLQVD